MPAKEHDRHAAFISHMPHALSFALANAVMGQEGSKKIIDLAGGGFKDMSRIAKSSSAMWNDIFRQNRDNLIGSLEVFENNMTQVKQMLIDEDYEQLTKWIDKANKLHKIL